jgi:acyl-CoA thioester hydrolase
MDAFGHVNNAVYLTYFEQARSESLEGVELDWIRGASGPVIASTSVAYKRPIRYPATAVIRVFVKEPGRTSFVTSYEVAVEGDEETLYATGEAVVVWVDMKTGRPVELPDILRRALAE